MAAARVRVRVAPRAREDAVLGWQGETLRVRVRAAAERGQANDAVCRLLAKALDLPPSAVSIGGGATSRTKTLIVDGVSSEELRAKIRGSSAR